MKKLLCKEDAVMQITLLPQATRTEYMDRRNMIYKYMLGNSEKSYRRSGNHKISIGPTVPT